MARYNDFKNWKYKRPDYFNTAEQKRVDNILDVMFEDMKQSSKESHLWLIASIIMLIAVFVAVFFAKSPVFGLIALTLQIFCVNHSYLEKHYLRSLKNARAELDSFLDPLIASRVANDVGIAPLMRSIENK